MTTKRGDVVLVNFPRSDQRGWDRRPALVVQADGLATGLPQVVLAMITSNLARAGHPSRVLIKLSTFVQDQSHTSQKTAQSLKSGITIGL